MTQLSRRQLLQLGAAVGVEAVGSRRVTRSRTTQLETDWSAIASVTTPPETPPLRLVTWDGARGQAGIEAALAGAVGWTGPGTLNMGDRGYSGSSFPSTFAASSISDAASWGGFGMLNVKTGTDWAGMAAGAYNATIDSFWDSTPLDVVVKLTWGHEPENDSRNAEAPDWIAGLVQFIHRSAAKIRARTTARGGTPGVDDLDGAGGVLMGYSFQNSSGPRYPTWRYWDQIAEADLGQAFFGIDKYASSTNSTTGENIISGSSGDLTEIITLVRAQSGMRRFSVFETALDRRQTGTLNDDPPVIVGTDSSIANWIPGFYTGLQGLIGLGLEDVCYFHSPTGEASEYAQLNGPALTAWANCLVHAQGA
jgi:hypothetical protein